ncbi:MAG: hypothetical protein AB1796_04620 [Bacillota bacterium]
MAIARGFVASSGINLVCIPVKDGKPHGQGTFTYTDGLYAGEWRDGWPYGQGTKIFSDVAKYIYEAQYPLWNKLK